MDELRKQITFYASFFKAIRRIKEKTDRCDAYDALFDYAFCGILPDLDELPDAAAIAFELAKPNLDASKKKAENGAKGGSSKQTGSKKKANGKQTPSKKENKKEEEKEYECKEIYKEIISYLNEKTGKQFRHTSEKTRTAIHARLADGFTVEDFRNVIDKKCDDWFGDKKMEEYLRPETLFGTKFEGYLNAGGNHGKSNEQPDGYRIGVHL